MSYYGFRSYVPVAKRRAIAARELEKLRKKGRKISPVVLEGRSIARTFWGKAWCENLERYSDFENRLPRGRTYVRNGSVVDLQIERGQVRATVSGSELYTVRIDIDTIPKARWEAICTDCLGSVTSLVELLQGRISKNVMERVCREGDGLFPSPREIKMRCSCPDWADMCKHTSASISATTSAAAYRCQNENVSARFEPGVETRAFAFDEHVDVASNRWRRIAKTVPHARPARLKSVHHILDRLRLDLHDALGVGKERLQQGRQPDDGGRAHQAAVIVSTDEIAGKSRAMHSQVSPSSRLA